MEIKVGNWVLVESKMVGGVCHRQPFLVTKIAGNRIYVVPCGKVYREGKFDYIPDMSEEEETFKHPSKIIFVFDKFEQAKAVGHTTHEQWKKWWDGKDELIRLAKQAVSTVATPSE